MYICSALYRWDLKWPHLTGRVQHLVQSMALLWISSPVSEVYLYPQSCCRDLHEDLHTVTTIPDQEKHCLEMTGLFALSLPSWIIDYWCKKKKKIKSQPFPQGPDSIGLLSDEYERDTSLSGPFGHCESLKECGGLFGNYENSWVILLSAHWAIVVV